MNELRDLLEEVLNENLLHAVISGARKEEVSPRQKIRPVMMKDGLKFQCAVTDGNKEKHTNYRKEELAENLCIWIRECYRQLQIETTDSVISVLSSKKGKITIRRKKSDKPGQALALTHNKEKNYLLKEGTPVPFLVDLGVMTPEGRVVKSRYDKFRQINRFLEFIDDVLPQLDAGRELTIIDFGCGKSYLTFAVYYYLKLQKQLDIRMIGLDLKEDVIEECSRLAEKYGYDKLEFLIGDIASYEGVDQADMVVTLHACDTATDHALYKAVNWNAKVILSVPCCQHELNGQLKDTVMGPVLKYGLIKERMAALLTDAIRADCLEEEGYQVQILEFIDMEHTPKNILIRAVKGKPRRKEPALEECLRFWDVKPTLSELLRIKKEEPS